MGQEGGNHGKVERAGEIACGRYNQYCQVGENTYLTVDLQ